MSTNSLSSGPSPPVTVGGWLERAESILNAEDIESPRLSAYLILEDVTGTPRSQLLAFPETLLKTEELNRVDDLLARRLRHEPMAYLLGHKEFRNLTVTVTPEVLIPRPETEDLLDLALRFKPDAVCLLDVGTGSGCLALSLRDCFPGRQVYGCDLSEAAIEVARSNDLRRLVNWFRSDWLSAVAPDSIDLIVSNPPYLTDREMENLDPQVRNFEPARALQGGPDGCDSYRTLIPQACRCLKEAGILLLETSPSTVNRVTILLNECGFEAIETFPDLAGRQRYAKAVRSRG